MTAATTGATGAYRFVVRITKSIAVRVTYAGNASCEPSISAKKTINV
jgi:hypothetical protein